MHFVIEYSDTFYTSAVPYTKSVYIHLTVTFYRSESTSCVRRNHAQQQTLRNIFYSLGAIRIGVCVRAVAECVRVYAIIVV